MKKSFSELQSIDLDDIISQVEEHAAEVEGRFIRMFSDKENEDERVPVFDFEIN